MPDWSELARLPEHVALERSAHSVFAVRRDLAAPFAAAGYGARARAELPASDLAGRSPLSELALGGERFVVRTFAHGGLLRWLTGRRFWDPLRPFRELALAHELRELGIRVPEVVAARALRTLGGAWELELVSRRVEGAFDLGTLLVRGARGQAAPQLEQRCARALGALVRRLHELGFLHGDLTPRNVLVEDASLAARDPHLWIVDLDGSRFVRGLTEEARAANLERLWRHVERLRRSGLAPRAPRLCASFLSGYAPARDGRRRMARGIAELHRRTRGWHAAADALERGVGARRPQPRP